MFAGIGWTDGTKLHVIYIGAQATNAFRIQVGKWNSVTGFSGTDFVGNDNLTPNPVWLQIRDDGTNVRFRYGHAGSNGNNGDLLEVFTVAKSGGFLGSSGYGTVLLGLDNNGGGGINAIAGLLSYTEGA